MNRDDHPMTAARPRRPRAKPKVVEAWGLLDIATNKIAWGVHPTRRAALAEIEWLCAEDHYRPIKVRIVPLPAPGARRT